MNIHVNYKLKWQYKLTVKYRKYCGGKSCRGDIGSAIQPTTGFSQSLVNGIEKNIASTVWIDTNSQVCFSFTFALGYSCYYCLFSRATIVRMFQWKSNSNHPLLISNYISSMYTKTFVLKNFITKMSTNVLIDSTYDYARHFWKPHSWQLLATLLKEHRLRNLTNCFRLLVSRNILNPFLELFAYFPNICFNSWQCKY